MQRLKAIALKIAFVLLLIPLGCLLLLCLARTILFAIIGDGVGGAGKPEDGSVDDNTLVS